MNTAEIKFQIISNFIDYYELDPDVQETMLTMAKDYVNQDHVDEIAQAMGVYEDDYIEIPKQSINYKTTNTLL